MLLPRVTGQGSVRRSPTRAHRGDQACSSLALYGESPRSWPYGNGCRRRGAEDLIQPCCRSSTAATAPSHRVLSATCRPSGWVGLRAHAGDPPTANPSANYTIGTANWIDRTAPVQQAPRGPRTAGLPDQFSSRPAALVLAEDREQPGDGVPPPGRAAATAGLPGRHGPLASSQAGRYPTVLQGLTSPDIAGRTHHTKQAVDRYTFRVS
jgi:hypothetical protein